MAERKQPAKAQGKKRAQKKPVVWSNRIIRYDDVNPQALLQNPLNYKIHSDLQRDATVSVIGHLGWIDQVKVNETTGFIVDGHLRVAAAIQDGQATVPVAWLDLTEAEEVTALATFDPLGYVYYQADQEMIAKLMDSINSTTPQIQELMEAWAKDEGIYDKVFADDITPSDGGGEVLDDDDEAILTTSAPLSNVKQVVLLMTPEQYAGFESYLPGLTQYFGVDMKQTDVVVSAVHYAWQQLAASGPGDD